MIEQFDVRVVPRCARQGSIACQERYVEALGESYICGIVAGKVVAELPDPRQQLSVRISVNRQMDQTANRTGPALLVDFSSIRLAPDRVRHFNVDQFRGVQRLARREKSSDQHATGLRFHKEFKKHRGV